MLIQEVSKGDKVALELNDTTLSIEGGPQVDLAERQRDVQVVIDVSLNEDAELVEGVARWYVATIVIPPRRFDTTEPAGEDEEDEGEMGQPIPLDPESVKVYLWGLPDITAVEEESEGGNE